MFELFESSCSLVFFLPNIELKHIVRRKTHARGPEQHYAEASPAVPSGVPAAGLHVQREHTGRFRVRGREHQVLQEGLPDWKVSFAYFVCFVNNRVATLPGKDVLLKTGRNFENQEKICQKSVATLL